MSNYLLNPNLLIVLSSLATLLFVVYIGFLPKARRRQKLGAAAGLAFVLLAVEIGLVAATFSLGNVPAAGFYIAYVFDLLVALMVLNRDGRGPVIAGGAALLVVLLLLAITVNYYYQYYPSLAAIFGAKHQLYHSQSVTLTTAATGFKEPVSLESSLPPPVGNQGSVYNLSVPGTVSGFRARQAIVYLPPAYKAASDSGKTFPVLVLLAGTPGSPSDWLHGGQLQNTMDKFAARHRGVTPVVVVADHTGDFTNDTECVDSSRGNAETYLAVDVPAAIKKDFHVSGSADNWGIGGLSEGGMCAAMLTLRHQNVYHHFLDMSGDPNPVLGPTAQTLSTLFAGSRTALKEHNVDWLLHNSSLDKKLTGQFVIGGNDNKRLVTKMRQTYELAVKKNVTASLIIIPGEGHTFKTWARGFNDTIPRLSYFVGATNCETTCLKEPT